MKNIELWKPSKYEHHQGNWRGSRDKQHLDPVSKVIADRIAGFYQQVTGDYAKGDLVEYGCGRVPLYGLYRDKCSSITCIDWPGSPHDVSHADYLSDLNYPTELDSDSFDTIICSDVLEHLHSPEIVLADMHRVLRDDGIVLLNVPFFYWIHEAPYDYFRYTRHSLKYLFEKTGFEILLLRDLGGRYDVCIDIATKAFLRRFGGGIIQSLYSKMTSWDIESKSFESGTPFPLGYGVVAKRI